MKKIISVFAIFAGLVLLAAPAFAQAPDCSDEGKAALYTEFTANRTTDSTKAYEAGKKYLGCSQTEDQYTAYLKKWVTAYEKEARRLKVARYLYGEEKDRNYAEGVKLSKEILAEEPDNLRTIIDLGWGSYLAAASLKNESYNNEALASARKAIQLIESGKAPAKWDPFKGKEDTLAYLYDVVGRLSMKDNPAAALAAFIKKAQFETDFKKDPWTYYFIAAAYESGPYTKMSADYKTKFEGKDETPESKLALENINQVVDRMVDAYARAVALAGTDAKYAAKKKEWMEDLSTWYKFRHGGQETGLNELIASVLSKPLPPEPTPLTTLPAPATTSAPAAGGSPTTTSGTTSTMAPTTTPATAAANSAKPGASTNGSTAPAKPKPRNNHATRSKQRR
jgi:hypothetical protein